ncbi:MAG: SGNH/GDSL hydrolase family protein [Phycisphaerae bacterium]|nr:SGNH/GDSL hydrolase family protein [Phycisphaerae bacterium]
MDALHLFATILSLVNSPVIEPGDQLLVIGDSITQGGGYVRAMDAVFAQQYPDLKLPPIINAGISGNKAEDLIARFEKDVVQRRPTWVFINVGINDVWHRLAQPHDEKVLATYKANLERMVTMAREANIRVVLLAPTVIEEDAKAEGNRRLALYVQAGKEVAAKNRCDYVDLHELFLRTIAVHRKQHPEAGTKGHLTTDGVHMTPAGNTLMAIGILRALGVSDEKMAATKLDEVFR